MRTDANDQLAAELGELDERQSALAMELARGRLSVAAWLAANDQLAARRSELEHERHRAR